MNYKIAIVVNGVRDRDVTRMGDTLMEYFGRKTPLNIEVDIFNTEENIELKEFKTNSKGQEIYGTVNGKDTCRKVIKEGDYQQVIFYYDLEETGFKREDDKYATAWSFWNELYVGTEYTEVPGGSSVSTSWEAKSSLHETLHALVKRVNRSGRQITDHMDSTIVDGVKVEYYKNEDPEAEDGNYERTINSLKDHWDVAISMKRFEDYLVAQKQLAEALIAAQVLDKEKVVKPRGHMESPSQIVVHHGADARVLTIAEALPIYQTTQYKSLYKKHNQPKGNTEYPDIAYHIIVGSDGWKLVRPFDIYGYHAGDFKVNQKSIAICVTGNYNENELSPEMYSFLKEAIQYVKSQLPSIKKISAHRDHTDTSCSGKNLTNQIIADAWYNKDKTIEKDDPSKKALKELLEVLVNNRGYLDDFEAAFLPVVEQRLKEIK